jgi:hypothetical protein
VEVVLQALFAYINRSVLELNSFNRKFLLIVLEINMFFQLVGSTMLSIFFLFSVFLNTLIKASISVHLCEF